MRAVVMQIVYQKIIRMLNQYVPRWLRSEKQFAIFPYGYQGRFVKELLNDIYGIEDVLLIDNGLASLNKEKFHTSKVLGEDTLVFLSSFNEKIYAEIRNDVCQHVPLQNICDIFSQSAFFDEGMYSQHMYNSYGEPMLANKVRVDHLICAANEIYRNNVAGPVAELGVFMGDFSRYINTAFPDRKMYMFDTFSGFDDKDQGDKNDLGLYEPALANQSYAVQIDAMYKMNNQAKIAFNKLSYNKDIEIREGYFPDTTEDMPEERFAFVSIDVDLYKPIKAGLEYFYPRLANGGYLFCHDFQYPGAVAAVKEFCRQNSIAYVPLSDGVSVVLQKPIQ